MAANKLLGPNILTPLQVDKVVEGFDEAFLETLYNHSSYPDSSHDRIYLCHDIVSALTYHR